MQPNASLPAEGFARIGAIVAPHGVLPISRSSWWAGIKAGKYPRGVKLGPNTRAWPVEDIRKLIADLAEAS